MYLTYHKKHTPKKNSHHFPPHLPEHEAPWPLRTQAWSPEKGLAVWKIDVLVENWSISPRGVKIQNLWKSPPGTWCRLIILSRSELHTSDYLTQHPPHLYPHLSSNSSDSPSDSIPCVKDLGLSSKIAWGPKKSMETSLRLQKKTLKNIIFREGNITNHFGKEKDTPQRSMKLADGLHFLTARRSQA